jgi:hypothetical protein
MAPQLRGSILDVWPNMSKPEQSDPLWRKTRRYRVDTATLRLAEEQVYACEACTPDSSDVPFDYVLDQITGCNPEETDYVLPEPARCPRCDNAIRTGFWRWYATEGNGRKVFVLPGTLVTLKTE